jgi:hypothetical protein
MVAAIRIQYPTMLSRVVTFFPYLKKVMRSESREVRSSAKSAEGTIMAANFHDVPGAPKSRSAAQKTAAERPMARIRKSRSSHFILRIFFSRAR